MGWAGTRGLNLSLLRPVAVLGPGYAALGLPPLGPIRPASVLVAETGPLIYSSFPWLGTRRDPDLSTDVGLLLYLFLEWDSA